MTGQDKQPLAGEPGGEPDTDDTVFPGRRVLSKIPKRQRFNNRQRGLLRDVKKISVTGSSQAVYRHRPGAVLPGLPVGARRRLSDLQASGRCDRTGARVATGASASLGRNLLHARGSENRPEGPIVSGPGGMITVITRPRWFACAPPAAERLGTEWSRLAFVRCESRGDGALIRVR